MKCVTTSFCVISAGYGSRLSVNTASTLREGEGSDTSTVYVVMLPDLWRGKLGKEVVGERRNEGTRVK